MSAFPTGTRGPEVFPMRLRPRLAVALFALLLAPLLPAAGDPMMTPLSPVRSTATWDLNTSSNYTVVNATLAGGQAMLITSNATILHTADADFGGVYDAARINVSGGSVRLRGNESNLLNSSTFDDGGNWTYANGSVAVSEWDAGNLTGRVEFRTPWEQFDDMDAPTWGPVAPFGNTSTLSPSPTWREGSGALNDTISINPFTGSYAGAQRNDAGGCPGTGCWNWSAYNRLAIYFNSTVAGFDAYLNLTDWANVEGNTPNVTLGIGWERAVFDLPAAGVNLAQVNILQIRFTNLTGLATVYVDDLVLFNASLLPDTAAIRQTIGKPATLLVPGGATISFRYATPVWANVSNAWLYLELDGLTRWLQTLPANGSEWRDVSLFVPGGGSHDVALVSTVFGDPNKTAAFSVSVDDVVFKAPDYRNATYTSPVIPLGTSAVAANLTWTSTPAPGGTVTMEVRTGNSTSAGDATWTAWTAVAAGPIPPPWRYLQYQATLRTPNASLPTSLDSVRLDYSFYLPSGTIETEDLAPADLLGWEVFTATDSIPPGTAVTFDYSNDSGASWYPATLGQNLSGVLGTTIRLRATLITTNGSLTPLLDAFSLQYAHRGPLASIAILPTSWSGTADDTTTFTATGHDIGGNVVPITPVWSTTDPIGNAAGGAYLPGTAGTWTVTVTDSTFTATATVAVTPGALALLAIAPAIGMYEAGTTVDLVLSGFDADGNAVAVTNTSWTHPASAVLFRNATRLSLQLPPTPGPFNITATSNGITATADLTITATPLAIVNLQPLTRIEDSGTYEWDLTANAQGDDPANLSWSVTAADPTLAFLATGGRGDMIVRVTPKPNAHGTTNLTLTLTSLNGQTATATTALTVTPVDDPINGAVFPLIPVAGAAVLLLLLVVGLLLWRRRGGPAEAESPGPLKDRQDDKEPDAGTP